MKKILTTVGLFGCVLMSAFSVEETWLNVGSEFGNTFIFSKDTDTAYLGAGGFNFSVYYFQDQKRLGIFARGSSLYPVVSKGIEDADNYNWEMNLSVGIGGKRPISNTFTLYGGLGLDFLVLHNSYYRQDATTEADYLKNIHNIGIGGDIGIKYDIADFFYANVGCTLSYLFYNSTSIRSYTKENDVTNYIRQDDHVKGYSVLAVKPYIGIGFNYYSEKKTILGKPKS